MNKIKVIDLLNMISKGEEVPKKIQVYNDIFVLDEGNKVYEHENTRTTLLSIYNGNILNYEVRIKEDKPFNERVEEIYNRHIDYIYDKEDKKIEKIDVAWQNVFDEQVQQDCTKMILNKINEIIDYINKEDK